MGSRHDRRAVRTFVARPFGAGVILYTRNSWYFVENPSEPYTLILTKFTEPGRNLRAARVAACGSRCSTPKC